jgi:hypothetical protein
MKSVLAAIIGLTVTAFANPAMAYVVEITTSISVANVDDKAQLQHALESAVDDVINNAIAFAPTVVTVQNARIVGGRMYILLLIADADGEKTLKAFSVEEPASSDSEGTVESLEEPALRL